MAQAIEQWGTAISYGTLLHSMTATLNQVQPNMGFGATNFGGTIGRWMDSALDYLGMSSQKPVMASNFPFDINRMFAI